MSELLSGNLIRLLVWPTVDWTEDFWVHSEALSWHLQVESSHHIVVGHVERVVMNGIQNGSSLGQTHSGTNSIASSHPARVDEPHLDLVLLTHLCQLFGIDEWMEWQEGFSIAGRESGDGLCHAHLSSWHLRGEPRNEMVHGLLAFQLGDGWHHSEGVTSQKDNVFGVTTNGWQLDIPDVLEWVADTCVRRLRDVVVVDDARAVVVAVVVGVLDDGSEFDGIENIRFLLSRETISLGVTSSLDIEHVLFGPDMLIITNEVSLWITG